MFPLASPDTQLFAISANKATEKNLNNLQKQEIYKTEKSENSQFVATVNVYLETAK